MKQITLTIAFLALFALISGEPSPDIVPVPGGKSGQGTTTRYWDCCKPSCGWKENIDTPTMVPVSSCGVDGETALNASVQSGCIGGDSYMCSNQQPVVINSTLAYGFAAASFTGGADTNLCCGCFLLTFGGQLVGKKMVVQNTNTGGDLGVNQFDIAMPGGGVGIFTEGCSTQWGCPANGWGDQYGGVASLADCDTLPTVLQPGCRWRFEFFEAANNPPIDFIQVQCPAEIVAVTGCEL